MIRQACIFPEMGWLASDFYIFENSFVRVQRVLYRKRDLKTLLNS